MVIKVFKDINGDEVRLDKLTERVYLVDDNGTACYFVVGDEKVLIIDTLMGYVDLHSLVREITDLPIMVVNTHGHCDHIFGNVYFDEAYLCPDDFELAFEHAKMPEFLEACEKYSFKFPKLNEIRPGDVIDLGGQTIEIIAIPGHTKGSVCLLYKEERILFTGDAINHHLWLQLEHSLPLKESMENLDKIMYVKEKADKILHGHTKGFDEISLLDDLREGIRQLVEQKDMEVTKKDAPYVYHDGKKALMHVYLEDGSAIVYSEDKLPV